MIVMLAAILVLSFIVWGHHMFTTGLPTVFNTVIAGTTMADRHPDRREDLQLARDDVGRFAALQDRRCSSPAA